MSNIQSITFTPHLNPPIFTIATVTHDWSPMNLSTTTWIRAQAADNEGSRLTGMDSTGVSDGDFKILTNMSKPIDAGVIVLVHLNRLSQLGPATAASKLENQFQCPEEQDIIIGKNGSAFLMYDGGSKKWIVLDPGRVMRASVQSLQLPYNCDTATISGSRDNWEPIAAKVEAASYASGLGLGGDDKTWKANSHWAVYTTDSTGVTIKGFMTYPVSDAASLGPIKIITNAGPGPIRFVHQAPSQNPTQNQLFLPSGVDYVLPQYGTAVFVFATNETWKMLAATPPSAFRLPDSISPAELASGPTNNYAPAGRTENTVLKLTANASLGSTLSGLDAANAKPGDIKVIQNFSTSTRLTLLHKITVSAPNNQFSNPGGLPIVLGPGTNAGAGANATPGGCAIYMYDANNVWSYIGGTHGLDGGQLSPTSVAATAISTQAISTQALSTQQLTLKPRYVPAVLISGSSTADWNPAAISGQTINNSSHVVIKTSTGSAAMLARRPVGGPVRHLSGIATFCPIGQDL